jgi:hypothetical protein
LVDAINPSALATRLWSARTVSPELLARAVVCCLSRVSPAQVRNDQDHGRRNRRQPND